MVIGAENGNRAKELLSSIVHSKLNRKDFHFFNGKKKPRFISMKIVFIADRHFADQKLPLKKNLKSPLGYGILGHNAIFCFLIKRTDLRTGQFLLTIIPVE